MFFFFFKQKTAYELRISDWSSDVCSSDLPQDGRPVFACPWETAVVYGTTDLDHQDKLHAPHASTEELDYLIAGLRMQFPELGLRASDALAVYAGVRPVVAGGHDDPSRESRASAMWTSPGLIGIGRASCRERVCQYE